MHYSVWTCFLDISQDSSPAHQAQSLADKLHVTYSPCNVLNLSTVGSYRLLKGFISEMYSIAELIYIFCFAIYPNSDTSIHSQSDLKQSLRYPKQLVAATLKTCALYSYMT